MTHIDHAAEARRLIKRATEAASNEYATALSAGAQAEATLALVEQQRIANLIALTNGDSHLAHTADEALSFPTATDGKFRPDIAAALGIGDDQ